MLNCCIEHRLRHENETSSLDNSLEQDEDGEEFYECSSSISPLKSDSQPEGRLKPCGELKLLNTNEILYIPVTQVFGQIRMKSREKIFFFRNVHQ